MASSRFHFFVSGRLGLVALVSDIRGVGDLAIVVTLSRVPELLVHVGIEGFALVDPSIPRHRSHAERPTK